MSKQELIDEYMKLEMQYVDELNREDFIQHTAGYFDEENVDLETDELVSLKRLYLIFEEHCLSDESEEEIQNRIESVKTFVDKPS